MILQYHIIQFQVILLTILLRATQNSFKNWRSSLAPVPVSKAVPPNENWDAIVHELPENLSDIRQVLSSHNFKFAYFCADADPSSPEITLTYRSEDNTIISTVFSNNNHALPSVVTLSAFADNAMLYTTSPWGQTIDKPKYTSRFAYQLDAALRYHIGQLPIMIEQHGDAKSSHTYDEDNILFKPFAKEYRGYHIALVAQFLRDQFFRNVAGLILLIGLIVWTAILYYQSYPFPSSNDFVLAVFSTLCVTIPHGFNWWYKRSVYAYPDAIDAGINPSPFSNGAKKKKNAEPTGTHPLEG